jgi:ribulose-phosphate 3-epimerase
MNIIAPSILSADFSKLGEEVQAAEAAGADWIHVDVMDGHFVPNITMGPLIVKAVKKVSSLPVDVHLMIENADIFVREFADAGADLISVHAEACTHLNRTIHLIKECGSLAGVALNPATSLSAINWVLEDVDLVVLMSVNPGFGGQSFIPNTLDKIRALRSVFNDKGLDTHILVDGGVNNKTIAAIANAGADVFVAGSAVFGRPDYGQAIAEFRRLLGE